jgi:transposase-like protein
MSVCPKHAWAGVKAVLRSVFDQIDAAAVHAQYDKRLDHGVGLPAVHAHLDAAREGILAFTQFPRGLWRQIWSNKSNERLNRKVRRGIDVVGIFPESSPTGARSSGSSAPSWPSSTTNGLTAGATSDSTSCAAADSS